LTGKRQANKHGGLSHLQSERTWQRV
jgi:hypothetical protein